MNYQNFFSIITKSSYFIILFFFLYGYNYRVNIFFKKRENIKLNVKKKNKK